MSIEIRNLKPELLWKYFDEISTVPRCSKHEEKIGEYILSVAKKSGLTAKKDKAGNIVIMVPATPGHEKADTVVLQGHLDMVCEKNSEVKHDFSRDPIEARVQGDWVTASGTTLGADNGIGMAAALSLIEDRSAVHGPLELLFTTDEETGLNGARGIEPGFLKGKILLNLDSEEEGAFSIGCAGGADSDISLPIVRTAPRPGKTFKVGLSGLRGGHSGIDIHTGRGNAVQLLARMLYRIKVPYSLANLEGGNKHNAIPREGFAVVTVQDKHVETFTKALNREFEDIRFEYKAVEKDMKLVFEDVKGKKAEPMNDKSRIKFLCLLLGLPHGVMAMSQEISDLVESSNNVAIVRSKGKKASVYTSTRSSILSALEAVRTKIETVALLAGATIKHLEGYPAWTPNLNSGILKTMKSVYTRLTGKEAHVTAIHAGLECGIIGEKVPGMDMISFGPELKNPHSPDERVHIGSVARFRELLLETLRELA